MQATDRNPQLTSQPASQPTSQATLQTILPSPKTRPVRHFALAVLALVMAGPLAAATPTDDKPMSPQQKKMSLCSKDAKGKSGDERRAFMKKCLSAKAPAASAVTEAKAKS